MNPVLPVPVSLEQHEHLDLTRQVSQILLLVLDNQVKVRVDVFVLSHRLLRASALLEQFIQV